MKNWNRKTNQYEEADDKTKDFLSELINLYKKHGRSIAHEDRGGSFVIENCKKRNIEWVSDANIDID